MMCHAIIYEGLHFDENVDYCKLLLGSVNRMLDGRRHYFSGLQFSKALKWSAIQTLFAMIFRIEITHAQCIAERSPV